MTKRALLALSVTLALVTLLLAGFSSGASAAVKASVHIAIGRHSMPSSGGAATIRARVSAGKRCAWKSSPKLKGFDATVACKPAMHRVVRIPASTALTAKRFTLSLSVTDGATTVSEHTAIMRAAYVPPIASPASPAASPPTASLTLSPNVLASTGGRITLTYAATGATACSLSASPAFWQGVNPTSVGCSGSYAATIPATESQESWQFVFTATSASGVSTTSSQTLTEQGAPYGLSSNWSGYAVPSSSLITLASGEWTVPSLNCTATPNTGESTWVGIGGGVLPSGASSGPLLQTGITDECLGDVQKDFGWWEEVPNTPNQSDAFLGFPVSPGNVIEAYVYQLSDGGWETAVDNLSTGLTGIMITGDNWGVSNGGPSGTFAPQGPTSAPSYAGGYTAEWIAEDYTQGTTNTLEPFPKYGSVTFSNLQTSLSQWDLTSSEAIALSQNGAIISTPSPPTATGFSVTYTGPGG